MSSVNPLIHLSDVKKVFYTDEVETHALSGIHLDIPKGEYISIAGPSGCGKSTLLSILGLLDTPSDGEYVLNEHPVANLSLSERARIRNREVGFIFQSFNLIGDLTVYDIVKLLLTSRVVTHDPRYAQHADRIVHLFDGLIVEEEPGSHRREIEEAKRELKESGFGEIP